MAPDQKFDSRRFLVRSSLVRNKTFVLVKGPFPNSAFGTVIPRIPLKPRLGSIEYESTFDHCKTVISDWLTRSVKIISKDVSENVFELFRKVDTLSIL